MVKTSSCIQSEDACIAFINMWVCVCDSFLFSLFVAWVRWVRGNFYLAGQWCLSMHFSHKHSMGTQEKKIKFSYKNPKCYVFSFSVFISVFGLETFKLWAEYFVYTTYKTVERQLNRTNESKQEYLQRNILRITQSSAELTFSQSTILDLNVIMSHFCSQNTQLLQFVFFFSLQSLLSLMLMFL